MLHPLLPPEDGAGMEAAMATVAEARGRSATLPVRRVNAAGFVGAGLLMGIGLGGFLDGIVLHQILQWHHMLTAHGHPATSLSNLETNTLWDGLFHAFAWLCTGAGLGLLWHTAPVHRKGWGVALIGLLLAGWGTFNLLEGIVDHHILTIHHVRDDVDDPLPWDLAFLAFGALLVAGGAWLARYGFRVGDSDKRTTNR